MCNVIGQVSVLLDPRHSGPDVRHDRLKQRAGLERCAKLDPLRRTHQLNTEDCVQVPIHLGQGAWPRGLPWKRDPPGWRMSASSPLSRGWRDACFSLISAAVVTSAIMRPEFSPGSGVRKGGRSNDRAGSTIRANTALGDRTYFSNGKCDLIGGERHWLGVKIPARDNPAMVDKNKWIVGHRVGLYLKRPARKTATDPSPHRQTCGWQRMQ